MKRLACILAALAMLIATCPTTQAIVRGTLQRDQDWQIIFDNSSSCCSPTAMTVYYLGDRRILDLDIFSVPGSYDESQGRVQYAFPKPGRGVTRIIIEVDPASDFLDIPVEITQPGRSLPVTLHGSGRLVFDVE